MEGGSGEAALAPWLSSPRCVCDLGWPKGGEVRERRKKRKEEGERMRALA